MPAVFVLLWAFGFAAPIVALRYAEPFTLLALRSALNVAIALPVALALGVRWPRSWRQAAHIAIAGLLLQTVYLACMVNALNQGVPQGTAALIAGMQPLITSLAAGPFLGERLGRSQWTGLALGFVGVVVVVSDRVSGDMTLAALLLIAPTPFLISLATLYQKRYCTGMEMWSGLVVQHTAACVSQVALALVFETMAVQWTWEFLAATAYLSIGVSIGALNLFFFMLSRGAASRVTSMFYLTPGTTAVIAWIWFGERLTAEAILGFAASALGVALVTRRSKTAA